MRPDSGGDGGIDSGDRKRIEEGLRGFGIAEVVVIDADGKPIE